MSPRAASAASLGSFCGAILTTSPEVIGVTDDGASQTQARVEPWGLRFAADPSRGWRSANVFWRPEVAADVVSFVSSPANFSDGPTIADCSALPSLSEAPPMDSIYYGMTEPSYG